MKTITKVLISVASVTLALSASAGVKDSKHNLGTTNLDVTMNRTSAGTGEVCVFCHTPHGANLQVAAPLWNKSVPLANSFTSYASSTIDGGTAAVGSVSIACLSCHDGSQAMDVMINQPGSGGYDANGAALGSTWVEGTGSVGSLTGGLLTGGIASLGKDLSNDHPVGIQYGGGGISTGVSTTTDPDFAAPQEASINSAAVWWVDVAAPVVNAIGTTGNAGTRDKTDMILYSRTDGLVPVALGEPMVECATCHDPHQSDTATFLRIDNTGSAVCLACHVK